MLTQIDKLLKEVNGFSPDSKEELEAFRLKYLGKKGVLGGLFSYGLFVYFLKLPI